MNKKPANSGGGNPLIISCLNKLSTAEFKPRGSVCTLYHSSLLAGKLQSPQLGLAPAKAHG